MLSSHTRTMPDDGSRLAMTVRLATIGCLLSACRAPKPPAATDVAAPPAIAQEPAPPGGDSVCASQIELAPAQPLGPEWKPWFEWGKRLELPSLPPVDPTEVRIADIRDHVVLARHGSARFEADGLPFADAGGTAYMFPVFVLAVDPDLARVRIVSELQSNEIFVWVDQADLLPVPVSSVQLALSVSSVGSPTPGVWLAPGRAVSPVALDSTEVRVADTEAGLRVEGTLPLDKLGYVFAYDHFVAAKGEYVRLLSGEVLAAPGGAPIAIDDPDMDYVDGKVRILERRGRWRFVEIISGDSTLAVRGYVPAERVAPEGNQYVASPYGGAFGPEPRERDPPKAGERRLDRGTRLLSDSGAVVGLIRQSADLPDCGADRVAVPTHWGPLVLRVDDGR